MGYKISLNKLRDIISKIHFCNDGDTYEQHYWTFVKERFPNCETFWKNFIVPLTKRIELNITDLNERIRNRDGIYDDIKDASLFHYSMFINLIFAYDHLENFRLSSFEDFYTHLGSACDLAEEFLLKIYLIILECNNEKSKILQTLSKDDFLKHAEKWYDNFYSRVYENYLKKGKPPPIKLPSRHNVLEEYFQNLDDWREYKQFTQKIREYRNVIVHHIQIGKIITIGETILVPKKEKILNYKKLSNIFAAQQEIQKLKSDFINMKEQMILDIGKLEVLLNELWNRPLEDLIKLFFEDKNEILLKKYNIDLTERANNVELEKLPHDNGTPVKAEILDTDSREEEPLPSCAAESPQKSSPSSMIMHSSFGDQDMKQVLNDFFRENGVDSEESYKKDD
jgi:hypothetical protein